MILSALALLSPAFAEPAGDVACDPMTVTDARPSVGQENVPQDARLVALMEGSCGASSGYELSLARVDSSGEEELLQSQTVDGAQAYDDGWVALEPDEALEPGAAYIFRVVPTDGWGELTEIPFTAGEGWVTPNGESRPVLDLWSVEAVDTGEGWFQLVWRARAEVVEDPDALALLAVLDPDDAEQLLDIAAPDGSGVAELGGVVLVETVPAELCLEAVRFDGAGGLSLPSEPACMDVSPDDGGGKGGLFGCSTGRVPPGALLPLLLALVGLRRR